ncbi:YgfZ/GcvT domain-containing protein [Piscirickettsia salmonis]|uniref:CAF17-like 4Fe-4S cluster assembly/insertion protein YgfZ n=2 Tax=Piscirickettsia salmonis TaxID=1238 RepID=UPI0012B97880|nr:folate-binding protein YgfZ [Piscirickettsia salmonis]
MHTISRSCPGENDMSTPLSWQQQINNDPNINLPYARTLELDHQCYLTALTQTEILTIKADLQKAQELMQGQFTCNINQLSTTQSLLGACCNPQGRIIATFRIFYHQGNYHLSMQQGTAELLKAHLDKFAIFYRAKLIINTEIKVLALIGQGANDYINTHFNSPLIDQTNPEANQHNTELNISLIQAPGAHRYELYGDENDLTSWLNHHQLQTAPALNWYQGNINNHLSEITPILSGECLPHDLGLNKTTMIDFNKGCYSGQEIIARMHYRGTPKRSGFVVHWQGSPAAPGDIIYGNNQKKAGIIINSVPLEKNQHIAFCSLSHQQLDNELTIHQQPLQINDNEKI